MPTINLINTPFVDGDTPTGTEISEVFYLPAAVPVSLEGINGWLDKDNADASFSQVTYDQVQENTFQTTGHASGTANLDYFDYWFKSVDLHQAISLAPEVYPDPRDFLSFFKAIPGGATTFYLPYRSTVVFSWTILWGNDSRIANTSGPTPSYPEWGSRWRPGSDTVTAFFLDNSFVEGQLRQASRSIYALEKADLGQTWDPNDTATAQTWDLNDQCHVGMIKNRYWQGHHVADLPAGWHSASLRLLGSGHDVVSGLPKPQEAPVPVGADGYTYRAQRQSRVWARSLRYAAFRRGGGE